MGPKLAILLLFFAVTLGVGIYCRRHTTNIGDFVLGGRNVGAWLTAFSYGTSYFSAVVFVGYAGQFGWNFGVAATWIGLGNAFLGSMLPWVLLGRRTRVMTQHLEAATMPAFFARRYDSAPIKTASSLLIFIFLIPYSASVYKGLSQLFSMAFHVDFVWCMMAMAVLTAVYVIAGGYMATAINDLIQGVVMLAGIVMVVWAVLEGRGGFTAALQQLSQVPSELAPGMNGALVSFFGPDPWNLLGVAVLTSLGTWGMPQMIHKFYTIRGESAIRAGTAISTVFALVIAGGSYFMGAFGRLYYPPGPEGIHFDSIVPQMLQSTLSDLLIGVSVVLVLSASMSTLSSLVLTSSSTFALDFLGAARREKTLGLRPVGLVRVLCGVFVALSVVLALSPGALISSLMSISWGALAGAFLGPFLYGLFWKGATKASVWASFVVSIAITGGNMLFSFASPINAGALAIVASLAVVPAMSLISRRLPRAHVDQVFSCYGQKGPSSGRV